MTSFDFLWKLLDSHGVIERLKADCARLWDTYTIEQQRQIYSSIRANLLAGKFVNYNPTKAILENVPKQKPKQVLTYDQYLERYKTTEERDGWKRKFIPEERRTIYVKR